MPRVFPSLNQRLLFIYFCCKLVYCISGNVFPFALFTFFVFLFIFLAFKS